MERCPIKTFRERLIKEKIFSEEELSIENDIKRLIKEAVNFAIHSPFPQKEEVYEDLFIESEGVEIR
jgi:pyruvate dehydrogenase E1 component alpha subunit